MTVVVVPHKPDHGHRDQLFAHLKDHYWNQIGFELLVGRNTDDPFNRSAGINHALNTDWDVAVIADGDTWVPAKQLHKAIMLSKITGKLIAAFDAVVELNRETTTRILSGQIPLSGSFGAEKVRTRDMETQSSMLVITRDLWDRLGGMDERFKGWGGEDNAFWHACRIHGGEPERVSGNAYHLWHPTAKGKYAGIQYKRNLNLWKRYERCHTVEELQQL